MPYLLIRTNRSIAQDAIPPLMQTFSARVAEALGKSERYVMVSLECDAHLIFAGDPAPCAYLELKSIGLPQERTAELSAMLCTLTGEALAIPPERIYIEFADAQRAMWGWNGKTF